MGLEAGGGLSWTDSARGLTMEAKGRALVAHNKDVEEWGASGSMRLDPDADGFGLSFRLLPSWGASESGVARLWGEGVAAARPADGGGGNEARLETELGYGLPAFGGTGVTTPYAGFGLAQGGERDMRAGVRLGLGTAFDLGIEANAGKTPPTPTTPSASACASGGRAFGPRAVTGGGASCERLVRRDIHEPTSLSSTTSGSPSSTSRTAASS